jgi:C4-type Zn-finger protein
MLTNSNKKCSVCKSNQCCKGAYLKIPNNIYNQRWVCKRCIHKGTSSIVKESYEIVEKIRLQDACVGCL